MDTEIISLIFICLYICLMLLNTKNVPVNFRGLAKLISNTGFKSLVNKQESVIYGKELKQEIKKIDSSFKGRHTIKELLDISYSYLQQGYRNEYIYKTKLLSDYVLKKYSLSDTVILNEFKIGKSIADMALVNGTNKIFEIKTELDTPERLKTQLNDYYKGFSEVYIVTHHTLANKYESLLENKVGIITFNEDYSFDIYRIASLDFSQLDSHTMVKSLRKNEFLKIIQCIYGELPNTTQVALYKECLTLVENISTITIQEYFLKALKARIKKENIVIHTLDIPEYLKYICYLSNFKENEYLALPARLTCRI